MFSEILFNKISFKLSFWQFLASLNYFAEVQKKESTKIGGSWQWYKLLVWPGSIPGGQQTVPQTLPMWPGKGTL